ncbi:MAG: glycosyltransferase family 39 protein [Candidatus Omnitrophica bacterium]|nr:glycosyltransferase family 39 protein [Candidatus Omnitrophota bacterium]
MTKKLRQARGDPWLLLLLGAGALLLLSNLGNGRLWQDEAETAVLGRNVLHYGYPRAFDGINQVNPALPLQDGYAWTYHSWLPIYLAAGSFALFGVDTTSARLPFALLGLGALWLGYRAAQRLTGDRWISRLTLLTLTTSVPFLLHMRQCRYYAPEVFFTLWAILAYWRFLHQKRWSGAEFVLALTFLFHADHGIFLPVTAACGLHFAFSQPGTRGWVRAGAVALLVLSLNLPWAIYLEAWQHHKAFSWKEVSHHLQFYFRQINRFIFPIVFWLILGLARRRFFKGLFGEKDSNQRSAWRLVGCLVAVGLIFLIFVPEQRHFRYLVFLIPWLFMIQAAFLARWIRSGRVIVAACLTALLLLTDIIHYSGPSLLAAQIPGVREKLSSQEVRCRSLPLEFLGELTHPYRGPIDGIVESLQEQAEPGETVKIPYEEISLFFYLPDLKVEPLLTLDQFGQETYPDWIILRRDWLPSGFLDSPYYRKIEGRYRQILLDAPDIPWQNRPDPGYHRFRTNAQAPPVIILRKKRPS